MTTVTVQPATEVEFTDTPAAVYRLYDATGALLYVGRTGNLRQRMAAHEQDQPWWPLVARKTMRWYGSEAAARTAEAVAIREESPSHNIARPVLDGEPRWGRHASPLLPCRPPSELADWVRAEAQRRGVTITTIINEALQAAKDKAEGHPADALDDILEPGEWFDGLHIRKQEQR